MTSVTVLGLGRMGSAMANRLSPHHDVRTWTRSGGGSPADAVADADVVLLCLFDGPACRDVLGDCVGVALGAHDGRQHDHRLPRRGAGPSRRP